jgi:hypothetical protein
MTSSSCEHLPCHPPERIVIHGFIAQLNHPGTSFQQRYTKVNGFGETIDSAGAV